MWLRDYYGLRYNISGGDYTKYLSIAAVQYDLNDSRIILINMIYFECLWSDFFITKQPKQNPFLKISIHKHFFSKNIVLLLNAMTSIMWKKCFLLDHTTFTISYRL